MFRTDAAFAHELDQQDALAPFRDRFVIEEPDLIYLDGNSLGRLPKATIDRVHDEMRRAWGERLIRGWNEGWYTLQERLGAKMAGLIGARPDAVVLADATSVNFFKLAVAALRLQSGRKQVLTDDLNFPSDVHILQGAIDILGDGRQLEIFPSADGIHGPVEGLLAALNSDTALLALSHTVFKSGFTYDIAGLTREAHRAGALVLWDVSHSAGVVPMALHEWGVDLAVGCTYKYLNGGPGAPAFLYVRQNLQEILRNPISGWLGQDHPFDFDLEYEPANGIRRFVTSTPPILSLRAVEPAVDMLLEAGLDRIRAKSVQQSEYLIFLWQEWLEPLGFRLNSPRDPQRRGSHVSLGHPEGWRINLALIEQMNVLADFREPDNLRLGIAPLYNSFTDIYTAMGRLRTVVEERLYEKYNVERAKVT